MNFLYRIIFIFSVCLFPTIKKNSKICLIKHKFREKSKNLPKSHKINKCWFLWWFLRQFFDLDPKVSFQWISDLYDNFWGNRIMLNMNDEKINGFFLIEYITRFYMLFQRFLRFFHSRRKKKIITLGCFYNDLINFSSIFFLFHLKYMFFKFVCNNFYLFFGSYIGIFYFFSMF